jgi:hypothetical protein
MPTVDKRITELTEASSVDLTMDYLAIDNVRDGTRKCKPLDIGAKYSLEQDETDSHVFHFTGTDGTDVTITTTDTIYSITQSGHSFTLVGSNGYEYTVAIPYDSVSMTQAEYDALTPAQKADGTARFITDGESDVESELWSKVGRQTLDTEAQVISNAVNELASAISELNSSLTDLIVLRTFSCDYTVNANSYTRLTATDFEMDTPTGYTILAMYSFTSGNNNVFLSQFVPRDAGTDSVLIVRNISSSNVSAKAYIRLVYIKSDFFGT